MKIRNGFVSNSSSSSFVVMLDKRPRTVKQVRELVFRPSKKYKHMIDEFVFDPYARLDEGGYKIGQTMFTTEEAAAYLGVPKQKDTCLISKENKKLLITFLTESILSGEVTDQILNLGKPVYDYDMEDIDIMTKEGQAVYKKRQNTFRKLENVWARSNATYLTSMLVKYHSGSYLCRFEASDNDSTLGATLEHGETFQYCKFCLQMGQH